MKGGARHILIAIFRITLMKVRAECFQMTVVDARNAKIFKVAHMHVFHRRIHWTMLTGIAMNIGIMNVEQLQTNTDVIVGNFVSGNVRLLVLTIP